MSFEIKRYIDRFEELSDLLSRPEIINDRSKFRAISKEYAKLEPFVNISTQRQKIEAEIHDLRRLIQDESDRELLGMAKDDLETLHAEKTDIDHEIQIFMLPKNPDDHCNTIVEIRAGTGGDEAGLFVADLVRVYKNYAGIKKWSWDILSASETGIGGFRECVASITGENVYATMKYEIGVHRVQRIPATETQGRVHTSAVTVAVLPEREEQNVSINTQDLKIDTYRSQGAGGQHVNTTDSAVRITHIPSGVVVTCQEERSQIKNRAKAMKYLQAKLMDAQTEKMTEAEAALRKSMVGSGDRSERIRTYNYPQGRITDHRIKFTVYNLEEIMRTGEISEFSSSLRQADIDSKLKEQMDNPMATMNF